MPAGSPRPPSPISASPYAPDIPDALGLLAPDVKLTLIGKNAGDKAFDRTAEIYRLAGAADKFKRE